MRISKNNINFQFYLFAKTLIPRTNKQKQKFKIEYNFFHKIVYKNYNFFHKIAYKILHYLILR